MERGAGQVTGARPAVQQGSVARRAHSQPSAARRARHLDIWDHIADDNMAAADRWVDELDVAFGRLATQPMMGRARPELATDLRSFPFRRYVIYYLPLSDGIDVVRVLHSARDIDGLLPGKT